MKSFGKVCAKHPELMGERYQRNCVQCRKDRNKAYQSAMWRIWWERDKARWAQNKKRWKDRNLERVAKAGAEWERANRPHRNKRLATRRAAQRNATPAWADHEAISRMYESAYALTRATGVKHNVDHIVPLISPLVCGLHVEHNLRVVTQRENYSKNNRWWPDMPQQEVRNGA